MKVNGIDVSIFKAKQLSVDIQPPSIQIEKEWNGKRRLPIEFQTSIKFSSIKMELYFKGNDRNEIIKSMSEFLQLFQKSVIIEIDGYECNFKGFLAGNSYNKMKSKQRFILSVELDGYMFGAEQIKEFITPVNVNFQVVGSRETPCIIEITALSKINNFIISGFGEDNIIIKLIEKDKTVIIDGINGMVTIDGVNAFNILDIWEFPYLKVGEAQLNFSSSDTIVRIRYNPMMI